MLHHRTDDLAERASSIADREAEEAWRKTGSYKQWSEIWSSVYKQALWEFAYQG